MLINFHGRWVLTDPALERRIGMGRGFANFGPRRLAPTRRYAGEKSRRSTCWSTRIWTTPISGPSDSWLGTRPAIVQRGNRDLVRRFQAVEELDWGEHAEMALCT